MRRAVEDAQIDIVEPLLERPCDQEFGMGKSFGRIHANLAFSKG